MRKNLVMFSNVDFFIYASENRERQTDMLYAKLTITSYKKYIRDNYNTDTHPVGNAMPMVRRQ